jgi:hypothetical protein
MADIDLKTETPDTSLPTTGFLFGADSQAAASPSVFTTQAVATTLLGSTTLSGATITADAPALNLSQTWNNGGVTFTGLKFNATDTASAAASLLMDLQVGGASRVSVKKNGDAATAGTIYGANYGAGYFSPNSGSGAVLGFTGGATIAVGTSEIVFNGANHRISSTAGTLNWSNDLILTRRGAANLRFGAADAAAPVAQTLSVQSVVAGTTNTAGANLTITGSQGTGTGAGGSIIFQVAPAGSSGTAQNGLATALTINSSQQLVAANGSLTVPSLTFASELTLGFYYIGSQTIGVSVSDGNWVRFNRSTSAILFRSDAGLAWASSTGYAAADLILARDAANTLALRNGANAQAFRVYNTFTDATTFERANIFWDSNVLKIGTEKGSVGGTARALEFQTDGVTRLTIATNGNVGNSNLSFDTTGNLTVGGFISLTGISYYRSDIQIRNKANSGWVAFATRDTSGSEAAYNLTNVGTITANGIVQFGGTTSSFPALKRSSASLIVRLADDTANAALESASLKTDAPTGGTAATWKLGTVASVTPTLQNRTIEVDIGGTIYYISAKTTND